MDGHYVKAMNIGVTRKPTNNFIKKKTIFRFFTLLFYRMKGKLVSKRRVAAVRHF